MDQSYITLWINCSIYVNNFYAIKKQTKQTSQLFALKFVPKHLIIL